MSKFLGFLLGIAVALVGPAMFGVLAADGGVELNAKEMALAYGIGALIFWTVVSYFSGAAAIGAALAFGAMIYTVHWIPNRMTNFLNDVPGVTTGMIDGIKQYTLNGVVPILAVISLIFGIQLIVQAVQRRRRDRAEADRLQRELDQAHAQQEVDATAAYPVAAGAYQPAADGRYGSNFGNSSYDDLFDEDPAPYPPRNQADEQTAQFATSGVDHDRDEVHEGRDDTSEFRRVGDDADASDSADETVLVPTDRDETVTVPAAESRDEATNKPDHTDESDVVVDEDVTVQEPDRPAAAETEAVAEGTGNADDETRVAPAPAAQEASAPAAPPSASPTTASSPAAAAPGSPAAGSPAAPAPAAPTPAATASPVAPASGAASTPAQPDVPKAAQPEAPQAAAPEQNAPQAGAPEQDVPKAATAGQGIGRNEQMGQQYRERMDGPDADHTGEFQLEAFENPPVSEEARPQGPRIMDLPGQFRPAGA